MFKAQTALLSSSQLVAQTVLYLEEANGMALSHTRRYWDRQERDVPVSMEWRTQTGWPPGDRHTRPSAQQLAGKSYRASASLTRAEKLPEKVADLHMS